MANLHIRNVPEDVVSALKQRARLAGRSLNAEVVRVLSEAPSSSKRSIDEVLESVRRRAERMNLPPEVADEMTEDIRSARDQRAAHIGDLVDGRDAVP
jgi:plasmid stability protein